MGLTFDHLWAAALTFGALILGWLHLGRRKELDDMKEATKAAQKAIDDHKLFAAENFAKRGEVTRAVEQTEERLKKSIEQSEERLGERLDEIRDRLPKAAH